MNNSEDHQLPVVRLLSRLSLVLLGMVLVCFLPASCSDDSSPVGPDGIDGDCIDYGDYLHITGSVDTPDLARGVTVSGDYACIADGRSCLQIAHRQCDR